jgi:hypothetical protein
MDDRNRCENRVKTGFLRLLSPVIVQAQLASTLRPERLGLSTIREQRTVGLTQLI